MQLYQGEWIHLDRPFATSAKGDNFCDFLFALLQAKPLLKRVNSIRKDLLLLGTNVLFTDTFSEGDKNHFSRFVSLESV